MSKNLSDIPANLAGGSAVTIDPMTTRGDIIVRDSSNVTDRLPVGTNGQILKSDGVDVSWDDADSGSGKNYTLNPSAAADDTTGVAFDTGFSVTRTTTASELPEESVGSAFKISGTGLTPGTSKVAFAILASGIDDADGGRFGRAKVSIKDISGSVNGEYTIQVYDVTNSVYVGDSDTITGTGTYYLDVPFIAAGDYEFHLIAQTANPTNIGLSTITIEPVSQTVAGVVGKWAAYTPSNTLGFGSITSRLQWRINGQNIEVMGDFDHTGRSGDQAQIELPNSYTIQLLGTTNTAILGHFDHSQNVGLATRRLIIGRDGNTYVGVGIDIGTPSNALIEQAGTTVTAADGRASIFISVPVLELANAHTPTASDVQYENARGRWYRAAAYSYTSGTDYQFDTEDTTTFDAANGITYASGIFTVAAAGTYTVTSALGANPAWASHTILQVYVNRGSGLTVERELCRIGTTSYEIAGSANLKLAAGDSFSMRPSNSNTGSIADSRACYVEITRVPDYSARKASLPFATETEYGLVYGKAAVTNQTQTGIANTTITDVGSETLTLPAGTYLMSFGASFRIQSGALSTGAAPIGYMYVTDSSNVDLSDTSNGYGYSVTCSRSADGGTDQYQGLWAKTETVVLASETTVKLRTYINEITASATLREVHNAYMVWERIG